MSTDYTPTTDEVREAYPHASILPPFYSPEHVPAVESKLAEFDRWLAETLAAHDREVAAKALEDAADQINREFQNLPPWDEAWRNGYRTDEWMSGGVRMVTDAVNRLRARAAALRIEGKEDQ